MCIRDRHYWVNAYVTPVPENNQVVGYAVSYTPRDVYKRQR
nr:hypothetical protein [Pseudomonas sp. HS-2]